MDEPIDHGWGGRPHSLRLFGEGTCPPDTAISGDMVLWPGPAGLAPGFTGPRKLSAVSPENELMKSYWWKGFALFGGEPRKLWLATWSPISIPAALECPENFFGRQGGEEGKRVSPKGESEKPIMWVLGESGHHWARGIRPHHPDPSVTPLVTLSLPSASRLSLGRTGQGTGHPVPVPSSSHGETSTFQASLWP